MRHSIAYALLSAVLFGANAPVAKLLLPGCGPFLLAALLYLGAGLGLLLIEPLQRSHVTRARLQRQDALPLLIMIVASGIAGPMLLMLSLSQVSDMAGSLLLNLE